MAPRLRRSAFLVILLAVSRARAQESADDDAVDELDLVKLLSVEVSTASKTAESIDEAPAVITVVTREDIARWGYQSIAEVLEHTVGFYVVDDHILPNVGVRGMTGGLGAESGVVKVMIDGRSVAYRTTSGNWLGIELVPLGSVKQIEIIRGPASALYGADAFLGVVNIITLDPENVRPVRMRGALGLTATHPGGHLEAVGGTRVGPFDILLGAAGERADRSGLALPPESPAPTLPTDIGGRRVARNLERESAVFQGRVGYRPSKAGHLVVSAYASGLRRGGDFAHWAQLTNGADPEGHEIGTVVSLGQVRINLDAALQATRELDLNLQTTYFAGGVLPQDRVEIGSDLLYGERHQSYRGLDTVVEARLTPLDQLNAVVGVETIYDREKLADPTRINRVTGDPVTAGWSSDTPPHADLVNAGTFVSINYEPIDPWLKLTGGLRYDHHSEYGGQLSGRAGATSRLSNSMVAKLLYGSAFKAPSPYLLYAAPLRPGDVVGNPNLLPQHIHTVEYQMSFEPEASFGVTSGVSHSWLLDKAEFTPQGINQTARNVARQRSLSWETRLDARHYDDFVSYLSFELIRAERDLGQEGYAAELLGEKNVVYPSWNARSGVTVGVPSLPTVPLELGAQGRLVGPRRAADTSLVENGEDLTFDPYFMLDVWLSTRELYLVAGHESRLALRANNVLLERGPDPGFSGFEYPLRPGEILLEFEHVY